MVKIFGKKGQGMTEYILIIALIALAVFGAIKLLGTKIKTQFDAAAESLTSQGGN